MWHTRRREPRLCILNIPTATAPVIKRGPKLFVNARSLSDSTLVKSLSFLKPAVSLAPTGAPQLSPMARVKDAHPGILKRGRIIGSKRIPKHFTKPVLLKISDATKKGKRDGNTVLSQSFKPSPADSTAVFGKTIRRSINKIHAAGRKKDLIYIIYEFFLIKDNKFMKHLNFKIIPV